MQSIEDTMAAIASVESGNDPWFVQGVLVGNQRDRKVGRYGVLSSRWTQLTNDLGYAGARWDDMTAQDTIVRKVLTKLHDELDDWTLSAVAFRYGLPVARLLKDRGALNPAAIEAAGYEQVGTYVRSLGRNERMVGPVQGRATGTPTPGAPTTTGSRSEDIIRGHLVAMRNAQRSKAGVNAVNAPEMEEVTDSGLGMAG